MRYCPHTRVDWEVEEDKVYCLKCRLPVDLHGPEFSRGDIEARLAALRKEVKE